MQNRIPVTIEELKAWYQESHLPPEEVTRFFIGKNVQEARAFGIYQDGEEFVVYKNKDDGTRAIRYQGTDEACAVNELYMRLVQEMTHQKLLNNDQVKKQRRTQKWIAAVFGIVFAAILIFVLVKNINAPSRGYYRYDDRMYYYYDNWYSYDPYLTTWIMVDLTDDFYNNRDDYYVSPDYSQNYGVSDFEQSEAYEESRQNGWENNDSWDSGMTDFSSDW